MNNSPTQFALRSRILHWLMAIMLLAMLFIGVTMVSSLGDYHKLVAVHRPLGIMILILAVIRIINRKFTTLPPFLPTMSQRERRIVMAMEKLLYTLMFALPLVGWGMLSAGHYPIVMFGSVHLPAILPVNPEGLFCLAKNAHDPRVSPVLNFSLSPRDGAVPHADRSRWSFASHGFVASEHSQSES